MKIRNTEELLSHGYEESRRYVLDITNETLDRLDARRRIKSIMHMEGSVLHIGTKEWDLARKRHVYLVGAGKACNHMAMAVDSILGDYLTEGIAIVKISEPADVFRRTRVFVGGHPLPNEEGLRACREILKIVDKSGPEDLFICVISGGSSALMSCPVEGISLEDERKATDVLLKSGAGIYEINAVRRHISAMNGGRLAQRIQSRGAELIGIGISDAVGTPATGDIGIPYEHYKSTPIGPDATTLEDARCVIRDYDLAGKLPPAVVDYIMNAGPEDETPKEFPDNTYYLLNTLPDSCRYAREIAEEKGIRAEILTSFLEGEARDVGKIFASLAKEAVRYGGLLEGPMVLLSSGEAVTSIPDSSVITGHGGPGQEEVLSFALAARDIPGACLLSIDSEGTDGTTDAAGGITDASTYKTLTRKGIDIYEALRTHSAYEALKEVGDIVMTGNTGTNLCDFNILYIPGAKR